MKRIFQRFRDDRFALTTLQNPTCEVRTYAELVQAAQPLLAQPLLAVQGPAQVAATQPLAAPPDPDSLPTTAFCVNDASTEPGPAPTALAPANSANPDSTDNDGPTAPPSPKPRRKSRTKTKSKSRRKPRPRQHPALARALAFLSTTANNDASAPPDDQSAEAQEPEEDESTEPTPLERHTRKCSICNHPGREYIEEAFLQWRSPDTIARCWNISSRTTIYHHAHAFNLFALRNRNLQFALGNIIEEADNRGFTAREILHAISVLAHVNEEGRWVDPTSKSEVVYSTQRLPRAAALPAGQPSLPAVASLPAVEGLAAVEALPAAAEPILITTQLLNTDAND
jgi:hypothetical protein